MNKKSKEFLIKTKNIFLDKIFWDKLFKYLEIKEKMNGISILNIANNLKRGAVSVSLHLPLNILGQRFCRHSELGKIKINLNYGIISDYYYRGKTKVKKYTLYCYTAKPPYLILKKKEKIAMINYIINATTNTDLPN